jgi:hypothetical protein
MILSQKLNQTHRPLTSLLMNTAEWCRPDPRHLPGIEAMAEFLTSGRQSAPADFGPEMLCFYRGRSFHALALRDGPLRGRAILAVDPKESDECWRECLRRHQQFLPPYDTLGFIAQARAPQPVPWLAAWFDPEGFEQASESQIVGAMTTFWTAAFALLGYTGTGQGAATHTHPGERPRQ